MPVMSDSRGKSGPATHLSPEGALCATEPSWRTTAGTGLQGSGRVNLRVKGGGAEKGDVRVHVKRLWCESECLQPDQIRIGIPHRWSVLESLISKSHWMEGSRFEVIC